MKKLGHQRRNLELEVYDIIKSMIVDRRLMPGDKIPIDDLTEALGVSRTPMVIALKILEKEMLITTRPRRGYYVRTFRKKEIIDVLDLREALEVLGARRAAKNISPEQSRVLKGFFKDANVEGGPKDLAVYAKEDQRFHEYIMEIAGGEVYAGVYKAYSVVTFTYHADLPGGFVRHPRETLREHLALIAAICKHDAGTAEEIMHRHMRIGRVKFISELEKELKRETARN